MIAQAAQTIADETGALSSLSHVGMVVFLAVIGVSRLTELARDFGLLGKRNGNGRLTATETRMFAILGQALAPQTELLTEIRDYLRDDAKAKTEASLAQRVAEELQRRRS